MFFINSMVFVCKHVFGVNMFFVILCTNVCWYFSDVRSLGGFAAAGRPGYPTADPPDVYSKLLNNASGLNSNPSGRIFDAKPDKISTFFKKPGSEMTTYYIC